MFGFGKKKKEAAAQEASSADVYVAPATGEYLPLSEVSDPVFSQGVMGDGYAVNPTAGTIVAPVAGTIALIQDTLHAFMLRTENGGEVLVHIGIDTVELGGDGFTKLANVGDKVEAGAPIIEVDWAAKAQERGAGAMLDVVFMSWALTFIDAPTRRTLY